MYVTLEKFIKARTEIDANTLAEICSYFDLIKTNRNQVLLSFDQISQHYYFINKGIVRLFTISKTGDEHSRYFAFEGSFCTALPSFIDQQPAMEYLQAIENCRLLAIKRTDFLDMTKKHHFFAAIYQEILELGFITAQKRIYSFQGFDALEKVRWLIKNQPKVLLRISNKMAASYLGISPSTLSRIKAKL